MVEAEGAPSNLLFDLWPVVVVVLLAVVVLDRRVDIVCWFVSLLDVFDCLVVVLRELLVLVADLEGERTSLFVLLLSCNFFA